MNRMKKGAAVGAILLATALSVGVGTPAFADNNPIIANGGFESTSNAYYVTGENLGSWSVVSGGVLVTDYYSAYASEGTKFVNFYDGSGTTVSAVAQSFPTTPGATYLVKYQARTNSGGEPSQMNAFIGGVNFQSVNLPVQYQTYSFQFTASTSSTLLKLQSYAPSGIGALLDNVTVTPASLVDGGSGVNCQLFPNDVSCLPLVSPEVGIVAGSVAALAGLSVGAVFLIRRRQQGSVTSAV